MASQYYFTHFESTQSVGGAKTGDPREKTPDHLQAEFDFSHVTWARLEPTAVRWQAIKSQVGLKPACSATEIC